MKSKQSIQISIPSPCHENWEAMAAAEHGRFCGSCQKVVTDFTQMEDAEIIRYFQEGKNLCGRFNNDQLNRPLQRPVEKPRYFISNYYKKIAAGFLFGIGFLNQSFAQQKKQSTTQHPVTASKKSKTPVIISGHLLDMQTEKAIVGMSVYLSHPKFTLYAETNQLGGFTFTVPAGHQEDSGVLSVDISGTKYERLDMSVSLIKNDRDIRLFCAVADTLSEVKIHPSLILSGERNTVTMGGPMGDDILRAPLLSIEVRRSFWHRITYPFKRRIKINK